MKKSTVVENKQNEKSFEKNVLMAECNNLSHELVHARHGTNLNDPKQYSVTNESFGRRILEAFREQVGLTPPPVITVNWARRKKVYKKRDLGQALVCVSETKE